jgi:hypothetical protein
MKDTMMEPDDARLHSLLGEARSAPPLPPRFQEAVWRRIERDGLSAAGPSVPVWLDRAVGWLLRPRIAMAGLAALVLVSGLAGGLSTLNTARQSAQARYLAAVAPQPLR